MYGLNKLFRRLAYLITALFCLLAITAWVMPSDVIRLISKDDHILLGRYGMGHFNAALVLTTIALVLVYLCRPCGGTRRRLATVLGYSAMFMVVLFVVDLILRSLFDDAAYVHVGELRLRPPNMQHEIVYRDVPVPHRTLPGLRPGYPDYPMTMRTDSRGFRNTEALDRSDVLVIGDSFAEGSRVDDNDAWANRLNAALPQQFYNIANSGDDPFKYLAKYRRYGRTLKPDTVLLMLYEGNDFKGRKQGVKQADFSFRESVDNYFRFAPLKVRYKRLLRNLLGPVNADAPLNSDVLDWLPFPHRVDERENWYVVSPKNVSQLLTAADEFQNGRGWTSSRIPLGQIIKEIRADGAKPMVVYAPSKARVMLPLVADTLDPGDIRDYLMLLGKKIPDTVESETPENLLKLMLAVEGQREQAVEVFFESLGVPFLSLTEPLRMAARQGLQPYFTYDQHWSPEGHATVAGYLLTQLELD